MKTINKKLLVVSLTVIFIVGCISLLIFWVIFGQYEMETTEMHTLTAMDILTGVWKGHKVGDKVPWSSTSEMGCPTLSLIVTIELIIILIATPIVVFVAYKKYNLNGLFKPGIVVAGIFIVTYLIAVFVDWEVDGDFAGPIVRIFVVLLLVGGGGFGLYKLIDSMEFTEAGKKELKVYYFKGNKSTLRNIIIPEGYGTIGWATFENCKNLIEIRLPNCIETINAEAFKNCESLESIKIPSDINEIEDKAFLGCENLKFNKFDNGLYLGNDENPYVVLFKASDKQIASISIHEDTRIIYQEALKDCNNLSSIIVPDSVKSIGRMAFESCSNLTHIKLSSNMTKLPYNIFFGCTNLKTIVFPNDISYVGKDIFGGCRSLERTKYENGLYIGDEKNPYLILIEMIDKNSDTLKINDKTRIIYQEALQSSRIKNIIIPNGVKIIGNYAISSCYSLKSITLPNTLIDLSGDAFTFSDLESVKFTGTKLEWRKNDFYLKNKKPITLNCIDGTIKID